LLLLALDPFRLFASALGLFVGPLLLTLAFALFLPACRALFLLLLLCIALSSRAFSLLALTVASTFFFRRAHGTPCFSATSSSQNMHSVGAWRASRSTSTRRRRARSSGGTSAFGNSTIFGSSPLMTR